MGLKFLLIPLEGILWIQLKTEHKPSKEQSRAEELRPLAGGDGGTGAGNLTWSFAERSTGGGTGGVWCFSDIPGRSRLAVAVSPLLVRGKVAPLPAVSQRSCSGGARLLQQHFPKEAQVSQAHECNTCQ